jgi:hypothetical protein
MALSRNSTGSQSCTRRRGFIGAVALIAGGLPGGAKASFSRLQSTSRSTVTHHHDKQHTRQRTIDGPADGTRKRVVSRFENADFDVTAKLDGPSGTECQNQAILEEQDSLTYARFDVFWSGTTRLPLPRGLPRSG